MSTGEAERLSADADGAAGDEEEEWLYGDENEAERPEEEKSSVPPPPGSEEEAAENGVVKTVAEAEDDSDSDSDDDEDDVQVTIGDIKTGAPQFSYGAAPVNLNIKAGGRAYGSSGAKVKGLDLDAPGSINGVPLLEVDLDSFEDKPWRKPGADLSDYFNYGFNEDTWKAYCEKQKRIRMGLEILPVTSTTNKITVQQGRTGNLEKELAAQSTKPDFTSPPALFKSGIPTNRRISGTIDVIGQSITISRVEGRRRANENSNIQVLSERSNPEVDSFTKPPPFFPPGAPPTHLPPPPFLPPPPTVSTAPPLIPPPGIPITVPPPGFPPPPGGPPPSLIPTIDSGHSSGYDGRPVRAFSYGSGCVHGTSGKGGQDRTVGALKAAVLYYTEGGKKQWRSMFLLPIASYLKKSPFHTLQVLHPHGLVFWTPANSGITMHEERRIGNVRERDPEIGIATGTETEIETVPETGKGIEITVHLQVLSTVMRNATDTETMQRGATIAIGQVERRKTDTETGDTERKKRLDTSHLEVTADVVMTVKKGIATEGTNTRSPKEAKKEKKPVVNLLLSRKTLKLPLWNRLV
ncbi:pre-mRNA 3'-end-processing factor FIP1 isoform X4 [Hirundo rustica]|uniref:pre-mRNA 3'-end-processing factor FIP1 isoform X4 n=1 Tax=Hirundo rustica TaxID=43150 RepID=UPI001A946F70|nr:pre-mRNA 3'-end-processing factor FIP1 isoform X4 [Hirundo rustica]